MGAQAKRIADVDIRWLTRRDMPEVLEIENRSFPNPWTEEEFICCLKNRDCIGVVAEGKHCGPIYGFMIYQIHKEKLTLLNFAVATEVRRTGVGLAMTERLIGKLSQRRRQLTTEISEENVPAQLFFSGCGFKATRCREGQIEFQYVLAGTVPEWHGVNRITQYDMP